MFRDTATTGNQVNKEEYCSVVMAYVSKCVEDVAHVWTSKQFPHQKWVDRDEKALDRDGSIGFTFGDKEAYSVTRVR